MNRCLQWRCLVILLGTAVTLTAVAQEAAPRAAVSAPDYSGVRYGPMLKLRCPDGEYRGPEPGKKAWTQDTYTWAVTKEFAQRFCMPDSMVSDELKGAEAVAFRVKPSDEEATCRLENGQEVCRRKAELQLELYLRSDLRLPTALEGVEFYVNRLQIDSSGGLVQTNQALKERDRIRAGKSRPQPGQTRPYGSMEDARAVSFKYLNFGDGDVALFSSDMYETYYQSNWVDGVDLIRLGAGPQIAVGGMLSHPDIKRPSNRFGIGVIRHSDYERQGRTRQRSAYIHVIDLPQKISDAIFAYDKQQGELFIGSIKRALGVPGGTSAPAGMEPAFPPVTR